MYIHQQSLNLYEFSCFMTEKDEKLLADFELRMKQLMYLCDALTEENKTLRKELSNKNTIVENLSVEMEHLKKKYDNLKFAKALSSQNEEEMLKSKKKLSKLVRDVDKCIALLKGC